MGIKIEKYSTNVFPITGGYAATAPGTIDLTVPVGVVGNPCQGALFTSLTAKTFEVVGTPLA